MESHTKVLGHPIHPILIVFPLGLLATAVLFDVIQLLDQNGNWSLAAFYMIGAGVVFGIIAGVFGFRDWQAIPASRAKRIGAAHGLINLVVLILFLCSWLLRGDEPERPEGLALLLSFAGAGLSFISGWLGGELVYRLRVGVDDGAHLNAPNSLTEPSSSSSVRGESASD